MDKNDRSNLSEYVSKEITQYYGADTLKKIEQSIPPKQSVIHKTNKLLSFLGIGCAVMFLTGASILFGVVFLSGTPSAERDFSNTDTAIHSESDSTSSEFKSKSQDFLESDLPNTSLPTDTNIDTDTSPIEKSDDNSHELPPNTAYKSNLQNTSLPTDTNIDTDTSPIEKSDGTSRELPPDTAYNSKSQNFSESNLQNTSLPTDTNIDTDTSPIEKSDGNSHELPHDKHSSDNALTSRAEYFSLPEYPTENSTIKIESDINNNSITNPYDNITTGRRIRAGIGCILMILSVITASVLHSNSTKKT